MSDTLTLSIGDDGVALLTIDVKAKPMNVVTPELRDALAAAIERVAGDAAIRGAVLTSGKTDFMAGGDIKDMVTFFDRGLDAQTIHRDISRPFTELLRALETCGKPFAAAINGPALGAGLELAMACHHRVAADDPRLVLSLPEVTIGLMPGAGGSQRLPRLVGIQTAVPLMLQGKRLSPAEALTIGLVAAVVPADRLIAAARAWILEKGDPVQPWDRKDFKIPGGGGFFDTPTTSFYNLTATSLAVTTQRNLPAPIALLSAVARGTAVPMDAALRIESRAFTGLLTSPVARNMMRTMFVSKGDCDKIARRPKDAPPVSIATIGVIGAGLMGGGIAQVAAEAGLSVVLIDATEAQAAAGRTRIADGYAKRIEKGRLAQAKADEHLARITATADYSLLGPCDLVVEAVFENRAVKSDVFAKATAAMKPGAILASNTSSLPITGLAAELPDPARFIGLHFFSPVDRMPLIEVICGQRTSDETLAHALDFIKRLRKTPIVVNDSRGFFTTRVISAYLQESMGMVAEGVLPALIDNAAKMAGLPVGPLQLTDDLTIELGYNATNQARADLGDSWVEPAGYAVQKTFVEDLDRRGRRFGKGFYDYADGKRRPWAGLAAVYPPLAEQPDAKEVGTRMLYIQALEAARAFEEGVVTDAGEGDVGSVLGIGFPAHTGGVFSLIDTVGVAAFVAICDALADRYGERWRPSAWLRDRAARDERFHPIAAAA